MKNTTTSKASETVELVSGLEWARFQIWRAAGKATMISSGITFAARMTAADADAMVTNLVTGGWQTV